MTPENPNRSDARQDELQGQVQDQPEGKEIEEFFQRLPGNFRWPKPNAEAVAAAVEAIHRMSGSAAANADASADSRSDARTDARNNACSSCGASLPAGACYCLSCGTPLQVAPESMVPSVSTAGHHHFHHHYHHLVPAQAAASGSPLPLRGAVLRVPLGLQPVAAPKPALARLCWTGCRPVIPGISMICSSFILPTLPSSDPASHRFAACRLYANSLLLCSKPVWVTSRWNRCASKFWAI